MDKRTLLFVVALSLTLLGVNFFFEQQNRQKRIEWLEQQKHSKAQKEQKVQEEVRQRIALPENLPLTKVYADADGQEYLTSAALIQNQILLLSWSEEIPETIYVGSQKYTLTFRQIGDGLPALYQESTGEKLPISELPDFGLFDLQLVQFFPSDSAHPVGVTLGQYADGHFTMPLNGAPGGAALALHKTPKGYLPVGYFDPNDKVLKLFQDRREWTPYVALPEKEKTAVQPTGKEEKFYVLEDDYQQLVFSNFGGALAEINLPFATKENSKSIVREIEIDRQMLKQHPYNAQFPAHPYYTAGTPHVLHEKGKLGGYYPLLRRDLIETGKRKTIKMEPQYYALNLISEYPETANLIYEVTKFDDRSITFEATQHHRRIIKTYSFDEASTAPYTVNLEIKVEGNAKGLWLTSGVPEVEWISNGPAPSLKYRITRNKKADVETIDLPKDAITITSVNPDWVSNSNGFFGNILDPVSEIDPGYRAQHLSGTVVPSRLIEIDQEYDRYKPDTLPGYMMMLPLKANGGTMKFRLFSGPYDDALLKKVDAFYSDQATGYNPDYVASQTMHGWFTFISEPFAKFLMILMNFFHMLTGSWALSIVLLTISLRIMMYPLNAWSTKSMAKMQIVGPKVTAIQEKYKNDPKKAQLEIVNLYREEGVNPVSGCLPLLIQMPFLIGMFDLLKSSFALRGAVFIPGWIDDLTAPDVLFSWKYPIFFIGTEFHLLPILLAGVMFAQQRFMSTAPSDVSQMTDQQRQQKAMGNIMTLVFAVMFYHFPSGLNIYWLCSMLLGMLQQWQITRKMRLKKA